MKTYLWIPLLLLGLVACENRTPKHVLNEDSNAYLGDDLANRDENNNGIADVLELFLDACKKDYACAADSVLYYSNHPVERPELAWWPFAPKSSSSAEDASSSGVELTCKTGEVKVALTNARFVIGKGKVGCFKENTTFEVYADTVNGEGGTCFDKWNPIEYGLTESSTTGSKQKLTVNGDEMTSTLSVGATVWSCDSPMYRASVTNGRLDTYDDTTGMYEAGDEVVVNLTNEPWAIGTCFDGWSISAGTASNLNALQLKFTMPAGEVQVKAKTKDCGTKITDIRDGREYNTFKVVNATWLAENVSYAAVDATDSWCYDDAATCVSSGRLYTQAAAYNTCPHGWHLPTLEEFRNGGALLALEPEGYRKKSGGFDKQNVMGYYWTSTAFAEVSWKPGDNNTICIDETTCAVSYMFGGTTAIGSADITDDAMSVRCVLDQ